MGRGSQDNSIAPVQNILRIAHVLREATAAFKSVPLSSSPSVSASNSLFTIDIINLPAPCSLFPSLLEIGASHEIASAASQAYLMHAEQLRRYIQESIVTACRKAAEFPTSTSTLPPDLLMKQMSFIFAKVYLERLEEWKEETIQRIQRAQQVSVKTSPRNLRVFKHEYVPLLEQFFRENPFPTHADKLFLAKKSNMEYRQIHVWFQNRRNRTKKEGKLSRRMSTCEEPRPLFGRMKGRMVNSASQVTPSEGVAETEIVGNIPLKDTFASSPPPHAFPSTYPPAPHYDDPFPCKNGHVHLSRPLWRRTPCGKALPPSIDVDELIDRFSQLNVRDETRSKGSAKMQSYAATAAITVIPSRAPHPSLIVGEHHQSVHVVQHPIVRVSRPSLKVFQSPGPASEPITLVPPLSSFDQNELFGKRKTVPLPRRFRDRAQNARRGTTPSESSSTSPSPRLLSLDTESCDSSSSISPPSTPLDTAGTHEFLRLFGSPCHSPLDNLLHLHDLGDMATIISSSVS